jgi:hypothetical protein
LSSPGKQPAARPVAACDLLIAAASASACCATELLRENIPKMPFYAGKMTVRVAAPSTLIRFVLPKP